jgi:hypothetical protein
MGLTCRNSYRKHPGCGPYSGAERTDPGRDRCRGYASDLGICHEVELRRLELRTSCMPWGTLTFNAIKWQPKVIRAARVARGRARNDGQAMVRKIFRPYGVT